MAFLHLLLLHLLFLILQFTYHQNAAAAAAVGIGLTSDYYSKTCPQAEQIVADAITSNKQLSSPTTAAGILRLFFHDCFVGGCDASVLISSPSSERHADVNLSLPRDALDAVSRAKSALELACPSAVSCADVLALVTRRLLSSSLGGPLFPLLLGRRDSLSSSAASVPANLPLSSSSLSHTLALFASKGFSPREMVALSGAHTVGLAHCKEFAGRIFNFDGKDPDSFDPSMDPRLARGLQGVCGKYVQDTGISTYMDVMTPLKFDNVYYQNLERGLGLMRTDQDLAGDPRTAGIVREYAADQGAFFKDFAAAMGKLSLVGVKTGSEGEVRRRCDAFNN